MKKLLILIFLVLFPSLSFAHKISAFVDVEGNTVSIESYFSDGTPVKHAEVIVYDSKGNVVLRGKTDKEGEFSFKISKPGTYRAVVNAELGHRAETTFQVGEVSGESQVTKSNEVKSTESTKRTEENSINTEELRKIIRQELHPIHVELLKLEEEESSISYKDIFGGLGWIVGIFGAFMFGYCYRRRNGNAA
ncbi:nickel transport protein [Balnearium lithotrophicum]|uniref:Nickel transport protein n=1 Tax=Balnearium lithotrophicum TaxID=223788 RepID=A0A521D4Q1_9BACT|nr:carboxypeptidase-like regulatory domain-containing protein [Balnearium lithotrophicum]SMO66647.1 nickel transport protein [Balnearium lithotrophicum]